MSCKRQAHAPPPPIPTSAGSWLYRTQRTDNSMGTCLREKMWARSIIMDCSFRSNAAQPTVEPLAQITHGPTASGSIPLQTTLAEAVRDISIRIIGGDRKSTRLNSSHGYISYAVFCLKKKKEDMPQDTSARRVSH